VTVLPEEDAIPRTLRDIPGWFYWADQHLFDVLLGAQANSPLGTLVELGVFKGKSAVLIGRYVRPGERFVVCDLFGAPADDPQNLRENNGSYRNLTRSTFERNYLALHDELPEIIQDLSSSVVDHVPDGTARFVHVDASHLYEHVCGDIRAAQRMLRPDGIVVFDDYRSEHTPGVAAAVWQAVGNGVLVPFAHTPNKLYATFGDPSPYLRVVEAWAARSAGFAAHEEFVGSARMFRVKHTPSGPKPADLAAIARELQATKEAVAKLSPLPRRVTQLERRVSSSAGSRNAAKTLLADLLPPALVRAAARRRRRTRSA